MSKKRASEKEFPPCGLYQTGAMLKSDPKGIPKGSLVMFHNHSNRGIPMLQTPDENVDNNWSFHQYGPGVEDDQNFLDELKPLREQGFYYLKENLETPDATYDAFTLVQLGYNLDANPILFVAEKTEIGNALSFPETGYLFEDLDILNILGPNSPLTHPEQEEEEEPIVDSNFLQ